MLKKLLQRKKEIVEFHIRRPRIIQLEFMVTGRYRKGPVGGSLPYEAFVEAAAKELGRRLTQAGYDTRKLTYETTPETCADGIYNVRITVNERAPNQVVETPDR